MMVCVVSRSVDSPFELRIIWKVGATMLTEKYYNLVENYFSQTKT